MWAGDMPRNSFAGTQETSTAITRKRVANNPETRCRNSQKLVARSPKHIAGTTEMRSENTWDTFRGLLETHCMYRWLLISLWDQRRENAKIYQEGKKFTFFEFPWKALGWPFLDWSEGGSGEGQAHVRWGESKKDVECVKRPQRYFFLAYVYSIVFRSFFRVLRSLM